MSAIEVKVCGLTSRDDALAALETGADYVGFVLYARSPRGITPARLETIAAALPDGARCVGVFVNEPPEAVRAVAEACGLHAVQIHGDEQAEDFAAFPYPVWRAVRIAGEERPDTWTPAPEAWRAERLVVDAAVAGQYGGTGRTADWPRAARLAARRRVMLAGGLTPANVADAVHRVHPLGVDVSSGIEARPGKKDLEKMKAFFDAVRAAAGAVREQTDTMR